jgi:diguanylate cyclase (GGDEF)-like protein
MWQEGPRNRFQERIFCLILVIVTALMVALNFLFLQDYLYALGMTAYLLMIGICQVRPLRNRCRKTYPLLIGSISIPMILFILIFGSDNPSTLIWLAILPNLAFLIFPFKTALMVLLGLLGTMILLFVDPLRTLLGLEFHPLFEAWHVVALFCLFAALSSAYELMRRKENAKLDASHREILHLSYYDDLTGIFNRRSFDKALTDLWTCPRAARSSVSLLMIDIDDFKQYNDHFGHLQGDKILAMIAMTIGSAIPKEGNLTFARFGGEEFVVLMPGTSGKDATRLAESIKDAISGLRLNYCDSPDVSPKNLSVSIGVATEDLTRLDQPEELIRIADENLYRAKRNGKNAVWSDIHPSVNS